MNALIRLGCFALLMVGVGAFGQSKLPACPSSGYFHNCFGTAVNNSKKYVGEFQDGKRNGQGTYTDSTGSKYVGEFKDDKFSGQGTYANASGDKYVGEFQDYKFNGQGTFYSSNGSILYQGIWADDKFIRSAPFQQASLPSFQGSNTPDPEIARLRAEASEAKKKQAELEAQLRQAQQQTQQVLPATIRPSLNARNDRRVALVIGNATVYRKDGSTAAWLSARCTVRNSTSVVDAPCGIPRPGPLRHLRPKFVVARSG